MYIRYSLSVCEKKGLVLCVYRPGGGDLLMSFGCVSTGRGSKYVPW